MDSYQDFLSYFGIEKQALFQWGIEKTIFPSPAKAEQEWNMLKYRVLHNQTVYIRGYGRDGHGTYLYKDLYRYLFGNQHVEKDPTNNAVPQKCIVRSTGLKRNTDIFNYQVSHIWGHTKNVVKAKLFCPEIAGLFCRIAGLFCHDSRANLSLKPVCFGIAIS